MRRNRRSFAAEANFKELLISLGYTPAWTEWAGVTKPNEVICPKGHRWQARVGHVREGHRCGTCAGRSPRTGPRLGGEAYRQRLAELGATPAWDEWLGRTVKHKVICRRGHECWPSPDHVRGGGGICQRCNFADRLVQSEAEFRERLALVGATPAWTEWTGANNPHAIICRNGHKGRPSLSNVKKGTGVCAACAGKETKAAEASYRDLLAVHGATPAWDAWYGMTKPHKVICAAGHECFPWPTSVQQGRGVCRECAGKDWDLFYVVANDDKRTLKFGISSGNPRQRLTAHRKRGYRRIVLLARTPLALCIEGETISALRTAGCRAVHGREYFPLDALDEVVQVAMSYGLEAQVNLGGWPAIPGLAAA
jgi:hypothetical protein